MIIEGAPAGSVAFWAKHLKRTDTNEKVIVHEPRGTLAQDLEGALYEMQAVASGSRSQGNFMYQANLNPLAHEHLTPKQWERALDILEKSLGLEDHQRVVVEHVKDGRQHYHVIWNRVDVDTMRVRDVGGNFYSHERAARQIEQIFDLQRASRVHGEREGERTSKRTDLWEYNRGHESGQSPKAIKAELTTLWRATDSGRVFVEALEQRGYILAKGDRRDFCIIDRAGDDHSLARRLDGVTVKQLRERLTFLDRDSLPTIEQAKELHEQRRAARAHQTAERDVQPDYDRAKGTKEAPRAASGPGQANAQDDGFESGKGSERQARGATGTRDNSEKRAYGETPTPKPKWEPTPEYLQAEKDVAAAWSQAKGNNRRFIDGLLERGYVFARVSEQEAQDSQQRHDEAKAQGKYSALLQAGEYVFVHEQGQTYRINGWVTQSHRKEIQESLENLDRDPLPTREEARAIQREARKSDSLGLDAAAETVREAGIVVEDAVTNVTQRLGGFIASLLGGFLNPEPVSRPMFDRLNESSSERAERFKAGRRADAALGSIRDDLQRGNTISAADVRSLAPGQLQQIAQKGDAALLAMIRQLEEQRERERDPGRTRER